MELENRHLKRAGVIALAVIPAVVLMGQARPAGKVLEAEKIVLRDTGGTIRVVLLAAPNTAGLHLHDRDGKGRALVAVMADGAPQLGFFDRKGKSRVTIGEGFLGLSDRDGKIIWSKP